MVELVEYKGKLEQVIKIYDYLKELAIRFDGKPLKQYVNQVNKHPDLRADLDSEVIVDSMIPYKTSKRWCLRIVYNKWGMKTSTPAVILTDLLVILFVYDCELSKQPIMINGLLNTKALLDTLTKQSNYYTQQLPKVINDIETGELRLAVYRNTLKKAAELRESFSYRFIELNEVE